MAVSINNWETYDQLSGYLTNGDYPRFKSTKNSHRFRHIETNIDVDIVPFGEIGEPDQEIVWTDSGNPMKVLGFTEALLSRIEVKPDYCSNH